MDGPLRGNKFYLVSLRNLGDLCVSAVNLTSATITHRRDAEVAEVARRVEPEALPESKDRWVINDTMSVKLSPVAQNQEGPPIIGRAELWIAQGWGLGAWHCFWFGLTRREFLVEI